MVEYKFSIVVPVYQAEKYLQECIESVLIQKESIWELILVDDGSTDRSAEICDDYAACYPQIKVIHKKNEGPLLTRYRGYLYARGKYIMSLDADDRLVEDALMIIEREMSEKRCDLLVFNYHRIDALGKPVKKKSHLLKRQYDKDNREIFFQKLFEENALNLLWNKVFKREYVKIMLPENKELYSIRNGEDAILVTPVLAAAENIVTIENTLYEYRIAENSITSHFYPKKAKDFFLVRTYMRDILRKERMFTPIIESEFFKMVYRISAYLLWNCARSRERVDVKKNFFSFIEEQELYQCSCQYAQQVKFPKRKRLSLWLFEHRQYFLFIKYEELQNVFVNLK